MLDLAQNPSLGAPKLFWSSIIVTGMGILLTLNALVGLGSNYEPVRHLVGSGIAGGFLLGFGVYLSAISNGRKFLSPLLDKKVISEQIESLRKNT